ncbi:MAG TPA: hypothetical protein VLT58_14645 [Polyangia bacterium]|nr:hypothetical protein [Polyangia bacterium]
MFTVIALAVTWPVLATAGWMNMFRDAQVLYAYERDAAWSVLHFGSPPLWDPYYCGGLYALGTPQSRFASPTFLLSVLFGPARGEALTIFAMVILGLEGTFRYVRLRAAGAWASMLAAPVFAMSGVFIASPFLGWTNFFGFELVPWALLFLRRAVRRETSAAVWAAAFSAWIVGFGGTYAAPMVLLLALYELAEWILNPRRTWPERRRAIAICSFVGLFGVAVAAVRLAPLVETLRLAPRIVAGKPGMTAQAAIDLLVQPVVVKNGNLASKHMFVVGGGALALAVVGLFRRRSWPLVPLGVAAFLTALGYELGQWGPFAVLKRLPLYSALRYPERYLIVVALVVVVAAANAVRLFEIAGRRRAWARWAMVAATVVLVANAVFLVTNFRAVAAERLLGPPPAELDRPFRQARGNRWLAAFYAPMSRGSLSCWDAYPVPMSPLLRGDLPNEEYLADPSAGSVTRRNWTPNSIDLDIALSRPTELLVNQNFHTGWRSNLGQVRDHDGLLAVALPAGVGKLRLSFRPRSAIAGAVSSIIALVIAVGFVRRGRRREASPIWQHEGRWLIAAAGVPLTLFAIVYGAIREPLASPPPLSAPSGEPVLAPSPPADSLAVDASFGRNLVLAAVRPPERPSLVPGEPSAVELDWRVVGSLPDDLEVVVSLESRGSVLVEADHQLISAALRFTDAPRGVTLRDIVPFLFPRASGGADVDVWVGVRKGGSHRALPVSAADKATRSDGRVLVTSIKSP